ncbi:MFS transporter [Rhodoferax saidenbachensis]|uniref:MFS transporter n=1 Tax=Rhodoferax saidenbachensis TaxID=1484693 RepID=A0A1P8K9P7_9BURK|nr:MFS transporter [Rhodoferax saidenbachensis]APW42734.1 MFS transporter [Rhodoferax saidenbachensis]
MTSTPAKSSSAALPKVLWPLLFGNFVIGTGVMIVPGTLNEISTSLGVSVAVAGQLIAAAAAVMCIGAPLFATFVAGWDRRRLLALSMLWYAVFLGLSALMPDFGSLLVVRVLTVVSPAIFTPQAAACVGLLVLPEQRGRAITFVFLGWSVASVLGMPIGALIGGMFGWRSAFGFVALLSLLSAVWVWRSMPNGVKPPALSRAAWAETFQSRALMLCVAVTLLYSAGQFVLFSYFAPYYKAMLNITPLQLSLLFAWFGAFGLIGNIFMSRQIDRIGAPSAVMWGVGSMALSLLIWPLGTSLVLVALVMVPWGLGCFSSNSAQQARLVGIAPALASGSIALNSSAMYAGQALGAGSGGWLIAHGGMYSLHWFGLVGLLAAMAMSWWATRQRAHGTV